eukprot:3694991-Rhodomonas_salina.1
MPDKSSSKEGRTATENRAIPLSICTVDVPRIETELSAAAVPLKELSTCRIDCESAIKLPYQSRLRTTASKDRPACSGRENSCTTSARKEDARHAPYAALLQACPSVQRSQVPAAVPVKPSGHAHAPAEVLPATEVVLPWHARQPNDPSASLYVPGEHATHRPTAPLPLPTPRLRECGGQATQTGSSPARSSLAYPSRQAHWPRTSAPGCDVDPSGQDSQLDPSSEWKVPAGHSTHAVEPARG